LFSCPNFLAHKYSKQRQISITIMTAPWLPPEVSQIIGRYCAWREYSILRETCQTFNYAFLPVTFPTRTTPAGKKTFLLPKRITDPLRYTFSGIDGWDLTFTSTFLCRKAERLKDFNFPNVHAFEGICPRMRLTIFLNRHGRDIEALLAGLSQNASFSGSSSTPCQVRIYRWWDNPDYALEPLSDKWDDYVAKCLSRGIKLEHGLGCGGTNAFCTPLSISVRVSKI